MEQVTNVCDMVETINFRGFNFRDYQSMPDLAAPCADVTMGKLSTSCDRSPNYLRSCDLYDRVHAFQLAVCSKDKSFSGNFIMYFGDDPTIKHGVKALSACQRYSDGEKCLNGTISLATSSSLGCHSSRSVS